MPKFLPGRSYSYPTSLDSEILRANNVDPIDLIEADLAELPVKDLRQVLNQALTRPFGTNRLLWLRNAEAASQVHQNTLLKILEEPPLTLIIVLEANQLGRFLPTVRSRLYSVESDQTSVATMQTFPDGSALELETYLRRFTDRATLAQAVEQERSYQAEQFLLAPTVAGSKALKLLEQTIQRLDVNANLKMVIDSLLLRYPSVSGKP